MKPLAALTHLFGFIVLAITSGPAITGEPPQLRGEAGAGFILELFPQQRLQMPAVLVLDRSGCVAWHHFGPELDAALSALPSVLEASGPAAVCSEPRWPALRKRLEAEGVTVNEAATRDRPVLIWYGSDTLCTSCSQAKAEYLPAISAALPNDAVVIVLEWKS
ncbi:hypothetical protein [Pseudofulvimonas gallinarii]|uniref:Uncharacterized protein n=1 Tax=Pseudofulvimonas gallinarii TaxID=634155 RepID=A0A4R3L211_9GAMM|nr:hypothetical protein [Pseudofulvimonas gallinarii]TCS91763.1 hypothetical protein EDC25_1492 [Pseudofulvimonas gallinarii]THD12350.1 hypothetical protein B1808_13375 [Pseudofulvimonas gallinarii]